MIRTSVCTLLLLSMGSFASAASLDDLEAIASQAPSLEAFLSDTALQAQYKTAVINYFGRDRFHCRNYEEVLTDLQALLKKVPHLKAMLWQKISTRNSLLVMSGNGNAYFFRPLPRRLHALFTYQARNDCELGVCEALSQKTALNAIDILDRWSIVLKGSQVHVVEKNGHYSGMSAYLAPFTSRKGPTYVYVDTYGEDQLLAEQVFFRAGKGYQSLGLMHAWLQKLNATMPTAWKGVLLAKKITESKKKEKRHSVFGPEVAWRAKGTFSEYLPLDPMGRLVAQVLAEGCQAKGKKVPLYDSIVSGKFGDGVGAPLIQVSFTKDAGNASLPTPSFSPSNIAGLGTAGSSSLGFEGNPNIAKNNSPAISPPENGVVPSPTFKSPNFGNLIKPSKPKSSSSSFSNFKPKKQKFPSAKKGLPKFPSSKTRSAGFAPLKGLSSSKKPSNRNPASPNLINNAPHTQGNWSPAANGTPDSPGFLPDTPFSNSPEADGAQNGSPPSLAQQQPRTPFKKEPKPSSEKKEDKPQQKDKPSVADMRTKLLKNLDEGVGLNADFLREYAFAAQATGKKSTLDQAIGDLARAQFENTNKVARDVFLSTPVKKAGWKQMRAQLVDTIQRRALECEEGEHPEEKGDGGNEGK